MARIPGIWIGTTLAAALVLGGFCMINGAEDRVKRARELKSDDLKAMFKSTGLSYPPRRVFIRAYKQERKLELWASNKASGKLTLVKTYAIAAMSGKLGPKRKEGDLQVPEGLYHIDRFNPFSQFRLSLGLNYPNASDRVRGDKDHPGSDIFIHGDKKSIGCLAMTDEMIDEIYLCALDARSAGQSKIPVFIFPMKMSVENLQGVERLAPQHMSFWKELAPFDRAFDKDHAVPSFNVTSGAYVKVKGTP